MNESFFENLRNSSDSARTILYQKWTRTGGAHQRRHGSMPGAGDRTAPLLPTDGSASPSPAHSVDASDESLRLVATVVVVVVGSSFQFGFGAAELNNVEKVVRDELESEEGAVSPDRWGLLVSGFSIGGLLRWGSPRK